MHETPDDADGAAADEEQEDEDVERGHDSAASKLLISRRERERPLI